MDEANVVDPRPVESVRLECWLISRFLDLGFPPSMAEDLVSLKVDWRDAEKLLAKNPPGGYPWAYWYLMPVDVGYRP